MSCNNEVVVTGIGVMSSIAQGRKAYWDALKSATNGVKNISLFNIDKFNIDKAHEIVFDPKDYLPPKGLRVLDRASCLLLCAAQQVLDDSNLTITDENTDDIGIVVGTSLGSVKSISDFDKTALVEGPRYINPRFFPNTVINAPAGQMAIRHNVQGVNTTISTGALSSIDAIRYAQDNINLGRSKAIFCGGFEELSEQTFFGFHSLGLLSGSKEGEQYCSCPFDKRRNGITLGEASGLLLLENIDAAKKRNANIFGKLLGFGQCFNVNPNDISIAIKKALDEAKLNKEDIDVIFASACSDKNIDAIEAEAIKDEFKDIPITAIKSMVGDCMGSSGVLSIIAALGCLNKGFVPPIIGYQERDLKCDLSVVSGEVLEGKFLNAIIINIDPIQGCYCVVITKGGF